MQQFNPARLQKLYTPPPHSHKGQNGKVLVIAGSKLFHSAALWVLEAASHIADMVFFASIEENNQIVAEAKQQFRNGIVIPRTKIADYIQETDSILIGPGMPRPDGKEPGDDDTRELTKKLLTSYPQKRWVIDGGSLQTIDPAWIPEGAILTPHEKEFETLFGMPLSDDDRHSHVQQMAAKYQCTILSKGRVDIVCSTEECVQIPGGNAGMTKGGTGDVLAGMVAGLYAKNDAFLSACAASYINKKAAESLARTKGVWYTASDLVAEIPHVLHGSIKSREQ